MGDLEQVSGKWKTVIKNGKNETFDFTKNTNDEAFILKTITAFSNTNGGDLLIGINEKSKITGISPQEVLSDLNELFSDNHLEEIIQFHTLYISHYIIVRIQVKKSTIKRYLIENKNKVFYFRIDEDTVKANKIILRYWRMIADPSKVKCISEQSEELYSVLDGRSHLSLSKMYKESLLSNKEVDLAISCLLFYEKIELFFTEGNIQFKKK